MKDHPTIIVTGSSGLVGSALVQHFLSRGFKVRAFQRTLPRDTELPVSYYPFDLSDVQDRGFAGADYIVHCAYRPVVSARERKSGINIDLEGTKKIIALARAHNIHMIFISTTSAHEKSKSYYAKSKLQIEGLLDARRDLILKLGLVLGGRGGLFGKITSNLYEHSIIPLIGGGRQRVQVIAITDVCRIIEAGIRRDMVGIFNVAHPEVLTMKDVYTSIADTIGVHRIFVPVPLWIAYVGVRVLEMFRFRLPFTSQSILGLNDLRTSDTSQDIAQFGLQEPLDDWRAVVEQSVAQSSLGSD